MNGRVSLIAGIFALACNRADAPPAQSAASPDVPIERSIPSAAAVPAPDTASLCPHTGRWALCNVENRLRQSGFVVKRQDESLKRDGFSVAPAIYTLGSARLEVFIYPDETALARDIAGMDTLTASPRGAVTKWEVPPLLVRSANLLAVFLTQNTQQAERLTLALTAGPPQPGSPR